MKMLRSALIGAGMVAVAAAPAFATPYLWTISGLTLQDGSTVSGSFIYDSDTNTFSSVNISTSTPNTFTDIGYGNSNNVVFKTSAGGDATGTPAFFMAFNASLNNAGGSHLISSGQEGTCFDAGCTGVNNIPNKGINGGGMVTASAPPPPPPVPTLSEWAAMILATLLGGAGAVAVARLQPAPVKVRARR